MITKSLHQHHFTEMHTSVRRTPSEAQAWLDRHGVTVSEWARAHGFAPAVVFSLLSGRTLGRRGQSHHAAVALGLKGGAPEWEAPPLSEAATMAAKLQQPMTKASDASVPPADGGHAMA